MPCAGHGADESKRKVVKKEECRLGKKKRRKKSQDLQVALRNTRVESLVELRRLERMVGLELELPR
jgi:hypothetical protein